MVEAYLSAGRRKGSRAPARHPGSGTPVVSDGKGTMEDLARMMGAVIPKKTAGDKRG